MARNRETFYNVLFIYVNLMCGLPKQFHYILYTLLNVWSHTTHSATPFSYTGKCSNIVNTIII